MPRPGIGTAIAAMLTAVVLAAATAPAQSLPAGWTAIADEGDTARIRFVAMSPGWHLSGGPAALIYEPSLTTDGSFRL